MQARKSRLQQALLTSMLNFCSLNLVPPHKKQKPAQDCQSGVYSVLLMTQ